MGTTKDYPAVSSDRTYATEPCFETKAGLAWHDLFRVAAKDVQEAASLWRLAWKLAVMDIKIRYRGSVLGPVWLTLSTAVMIGTMGVVFGYLFHMNMKTYFTYLTLSTILWNFLSAMVTDGCNAFIQVEGVIKGMKMPYSLHSARVVLRNLIILGHNMVIAVAVLVLFRVPLNGFIFLAIPGLLLWLVDGFLAGLLLGIFCTRFRDVPQIVQSILQIVYFATPVMWLPSLLKGHPRLRTLVMVNPAAALLHIVRAPVLDHQVGHLAWAVALLFSAALFLLTAVVFSRMRSRIAFWV